jgi:hypothetical protein
LSRASLAHGASVADEDVETIPGAVDALEPDIVGR